MVDQIQQGQAVIQGILGRLCAERRVRLSDSVKWHYDFDHASYWMEFSIEGALKRWKFSREQIEDAANDARVQRQIEMTLAQYVIPSESEVERLTTPSMQLDAESKSEKKDDVFICHATEDKDYVEPLARELDAAGIRVWYDKSSLDWGDDLRSGIDRGLHKCAFGLVILSPAFLRKKKWTEYELSGLFAKEEVGRPNVILPILHKVTIEEVARYSPSLSIRLAKDSSTDSVADIINSLKRKLGRDMPKSSRNEVVISAKVTRMVLMPQNPLHEMTLEVLRLTGRTNPEVTADLLAELFVVNTSDSPITVRKIRAEAYLGDTWKELTANPDLSTYELQREVSRPTAGMPGVSTVKTERKPLRSLFHLTDGPPLVRGVHSIGWLRFEVVGTATEFEGKVNFRMGVIDSLRYVHEVSTSEPFESDEWQIAHNPNKVWDD